MAFELVIFDCDGILIDSEKISCENFVDCLSEIGLTVTLQQCIDTFVGKAAEVNMKTVESWLEAPLPSGFWQRFKNKADIAFEKNLRPIEGIEVALQAIALPKCVASSSEPELIRKNLALTGLLHQFEGNIFSATHVAHGKPAPDLFLHAAKTMKVAPSHCAVIEDSVAGVTAGRAAGMTVFAYSGTFPGESLQQAGAHSIFDDMKSLPRLLNVTQQLHVE